jgi:hypothetical protein
MAVSPKPVKKFGKVYLNREARALLSPAAVALKRLGDSSDGNAEFIAVLSADPQIPAKISKLLAELQKPEHARHSLARVAGECGVQVSDVFVSFSRGIKALGCAEAINRASEIMLQKWEASIEALTDQAIPDRKPCKNCPPETEPNPNCNLCYGKGYREVLPKFFAYAQNKMIDFFGMNPKIEAKLGGVVVNNNVRASANAASASAPTFSAQLLAMSDEIINSKPQDLLDAEVIAALPEPQPLVLPEAHSTSLGEAGSRVLQEAEQKIRL